MMDYFLMRKDDVITICDISESGEMISWSEKMRFPELAPIGFRAHRDYLKKWWEDRRAPIGQGRLRTILEEHGMSDPADYLIQNLGLSLTDYYWMKPVGSHLKWKDVNLFENAFSGDALQTYGFSFRHKKNFSGLTPNSSLQGELEKCWMIRHGKRCLIKGNHGKLSSESINEVVATEFHKLQKYDNFTKYKLLSIKNKPYDYGCYSKAFTGSHREFVSAWSVLTSKKKPSGMSNYEHLINVAGEHGIDTDQLRRDLEYQIVSDYLLSNTDRHMENIGFLRDADTLKFIRMAPIFDTGRAFAAGSVVPYTQYEIENIGVNSFRNTETELLSLVRDKSVVDMKKLLSADRIAELYSKDSKIDWGRINSIIRLYEEKQKLLERL